MTDEAGKVTSLAPPWQRPPSSARQCQVTISQVPPSITRDIANDYTLCVNANVCQEVSCYKARVSCSMTNDVPNEGWTSMSVLKSRRDFNYSSVWLPAWPSVKTWTEVNYGDDVLSISGRIPYEWAGLGNGTLSKVIIILSEGQEKKKKVLRKSRFTGNIVGLQHSSGFDLLPSLKLRAICAK